MPNKKFKKILLVAPQISIFPEYDDLRIAQSFGLACISGSLKACGYEVEFLDAAAEGATNRQFIDEGLLKVGLSDDEVRSRISKLQPDIVAVSNLHTPQFANAVNICKVAKSTNEDIVTILGGTHASLNYADALNTHCIDFVVIGEGEVRLIKLLDVLNGKAELDKCYGIATIFNNQVLFIEPEINYLDFFPDSSREGLIIPEGWQWNISDMDFLPDPDFALFNKTLYRSEAFYAGIIRGKAAIPYVSSRGCPQQCRFCCSNTMWGPKFRSYSIGAIAKHLDIIASLGYDEVLFEDDNILVNPTLSKAVFNTLRENGFIWSITGGLDRSRLTNEIVDLLIENNCARVNIGVESEDLLLLRKYNKYKGVEDARLELCEHIRRLTEGGVETFGDFMIGFPEQNIKDIGKTVEFAKSLKDSGLGLALFHIVTPFPGTKFYKESVKKGYLSNSIRFENFTFARGNITNSSFTAEAITELRIKAYIEVNGQEMWTESRKQLKRPDLFKFYKDHPNNKWSVFFLNK